MSRHQAAAGLGLAFAALILLGGCDRVPGAGAVPDTAATPQTPAAPLNPASAAVTESPTQDPALAEWRRDEAQVLKALGQTEARKGPVLALVNAGRVVLSLKDTESEAWVLTQVLRMTRDGVEQVHYEVTRHLVGEVDEPSVTLFDQNGARLDSYSGWASWRGAVAAISWSDPAYDVDSADAATVELRDLSVTPHRRYVFQARCNASSWISDTELKAVCSRPALTDPARSVALNGNSEDIDAVIRRVGPNTWRLRELQAPRARLMDVENNPATAYDETVRGVAYSGDNASPE